MIIIITKKSIYYVINIAPNPFVISKFVNCL